MRRAPLPDPADMQRLALMARQIGHDFNNYLSSVLGYAALLKTKLPGGEKVHHYAEMIETAGNEAGTAAERLLTFGRIWTSKPSLIPVSLDAAQETIAHTVQHGEFGPEAGVDAETSELEGRLAVDLRAMQRGIDALRSNACEAQPDADPPRLRLRIGAVGDEALPEAPPAASPSGKWLCVEICDEGKGMDDETLAQAAAAGFTTHGGARRQGLGLPTAFGFAHTHGGLMALMSAEGEGTTASIWLPIHEAR